MPAVLVLLLGLGPGPALPSGDVHEELYGRALTRALDAAQADLLAGIQLWKDHSRWEDPWVAESEHYTVRTTASYALGAKIAADLEFMFGEFQRLLATPFEPPERFKVWIFPSLDDFNTFGGNAEEHSSMYGGYFAVQAPERPVAAYYTSDLTQLGMFVTHGAAHQFMENAFSGQPPVWISEGLASYFALYWDTGMARATRQLERLKSSGFVPLERLTRAPIQDYLSGAEIRFVELGMLFHYLLNLREDTKIGVGDDPSSGPFLEYVRSVLRGRNISQLDLAPLLAEDIDVLEEDFKAFDFSK